MNIAKWIAAHTKIKKKIERAHFVSDSEYQHA